MLLSPSFIVLCQVVLSLNLAQAAFTPWWLGGSQLSTDPSNHITLDYGDFIGQVDSGVQSWTGIPYADSPTGTNRFTPAVAPTKQFPNFDATRASVGCPQPNPTAGGTPLDLLRLNMTVLRVFTSLPRGSMSLTQTPSSEDCLNLDVKKPAGLPQDAKLPVLFWIPAAKTGTFDPAGLMARGVMNKQPFIIVTPNFRSNLFGGLGGKEIAAADGANLGLRDQRLALEWVQKYISKFGGDPSRVTLIGADEGSMAVSTHLVAFDGEHKDLFNSAVLLGGVALPMPPVEGGQEVYDKVVKAAGCPDGSGSLECLRQADYATLLAALNSFPNMFSQDRFPLPFRSYVDGKFLTASIQNLLKDGKVAKVPIIAGMVDDAGTISTLVEAAHVFDEAAVTTWLTRMLPGAKPEEIDQYMKLYPTNPEAGSPFNTGNENAFNAVSKQVAAIFGDIAFQGIRRYFSQSTQSLMPIFSYIDRGNKDTRYLGSYSGSDVLSLLASPTSGRNNEYQSRILSFLYTQDPNPKGMNLADWPQYGSEGEMLEFNDQGVSPKPVTDSFRQDALSYYIQNLMGDGFKHD